MQHVFFCILCFYTRFLCYLRHLIGFNEVYIHAIESIFKNFIHKTLNSFAISLCMPLRKLLVC